MEQDSRFPEIRLDQAEDLRGSLRLGVVAAAPVAVGPASGQLVRETEELCRRLRASLAGKAPAEIERLRPARELYKLFGIDPTKTRPSSESLLRRVLRGKPMPRILNAVDFCNLCSLEFLLPLGLYDADKIHGDVLLRRGMPGESFAGIRKDEVHLAGRPVLVDRDGPFGNPTSDSLRTCVGPSTRSLWMVIFAPASVTREEMSLHVRYAVDGIERYLVPESRAGCCKGEVIR